MILELSNMHISIHAFIQTNFYISRVNLCNALVFSISQGQIMTNEQVTSSCNCYRELRNSTFFLILTNNKCSVAINNCQNTLILLVCLG